MKKLIICEKNSLARGIKHGIESADNTKMETVVYYKGKDALTSLIYYENSKYIITSVVGHIFELYSIADYEGLDKINWKSISLPYVPENYKFKIKLKDEFKKRFKMIKELVVRRDVDGIFNCGDNDREGEILIREVLNEINTSKPIYRLALSEVTDTSVTRGLNDLRSDDEFDDIANEGFARQYCDWLYGINLTTYATVKMNGGMYSVGRVISAVINAVYERDLAIENFKSRKYITGVSKELTNGIEIELTDKESFLSNENNYFTEEIVERYSKYFNDLNSTVFKIAKKISKKRRVKRPKLFSQGKLQNLMNEKYGYSPKETLESVQQLYLAGFVTYPRTSSEYMSTGEKDKVGEIIDNLNNHWNCRLAFRDSKSIFDDSKVESHSAVTPTTRLPDIDQLSLKLKNTYLEILNRFQAVFYSDEYIINETVLVVSNGKSEYVLKGNTVIQKGWSIFFKGKREKELPDLWENDTVNVHFNPIVRRTEPPKHYTVTTLNNFMINPFKKETKENDDELYRSIHAGVEIGTEATRPDIIERTVKYGLIALNGSVYKITDKGKEYVKVLRRLKIDITTEKSVYLNTLIKSVYRKELTVKQCCATVYDEINDIIAEDITVDDMKKETELEYTGEVCPECGSRLVYKKGKYGKFEACSNYPECRYIKPKESKIEYTGEACPECGGRMVYKKGKYGKFEACPNYPECRHIKKK